MDYYSSIVSVLCEATLQEKDLVRTCYFYNLKVDSFLKTLHSKVKELTTSSSSEVAMFQNTNTDSQLGNSNPVFEVYS